MNQQQTVKDITKLSVIPLTDKPLTNKNVTNQALTSKLINVLALLLLFSDYS